MFSIRKKWIVCQCFSNSCCHKPLHDTLDWFQRNLFVIVFCVVGTEEDMGGDGAEESTGVENKIVVRTRRTAVTRTLVPLFASPSIVFLWPTQGRIGIDS